MLKCFYYLPTARFVFLAVTWVTSPFLLLVCCFFTLLLTTVFTQKGFLKLFVLLNDVTGMFSSPFPIVSFICKIGQCFCMILGAFVAVQLNVINSCMQVE